MLIYGDELFSNDAFIQWPSSNSIYIIHVYMKKYSKLQFNNDYTLAKRFEI